MGLVTRISENRVGPLLGRVRKFMFYLSPASRVPDGAEGLYLQVSPHKGAACCTPESRFQLPGFC